MKRHYDPRDSVVTGTTNGERCRSPRPPPTPSEPGLVVYRFGVGLFFANASRFTEEAIALVDVPEPPRWLVLLADAIDDVDFTGGKTLSELADQLEQRGVVLAVARARTAVVAELDRFGVTDRIGRDTSSDRSTRRSPPSAPTNPDPGIMIAG